MKLQLFQRFLLISFSFVLITSCNKGKDKMDVQGHRGFRGLYPENTIQGFLKALDAGVTTLELDVVISMDAQVVVSHEPFFSHEISTGPDGIEITSKNERSYNIFKMNYEEIRQFDVGLKPHKRFPQQVKIAATKPLLKQVIETVEHYVQEHNLPVPNYNIELKRLAKNDGVFHPNAEIFSKLVLAVLNETGIEKRTSLQAFDVSTLRMLKELNSLIPLVLLVENQLGIEKNIEKLGFKPDIYSPEFSEVDATLVAYCKLHNIKIIPWTVNKIEDIKKMINLEVDGIISDFPDRVLSQIKH